MRWSISICRIFHIQIRIHATFFLLLGLLAYVSHRPGQPVNYWPILLIMGLFFCVLLHELAHCLTAQTYGIKVDSITLLPIGGVAILRSMPTHAQEEIVIAAAGPICSFIIAAVFYLAGYMDFNQLLLPKTLPLQSLEDVLRILGPLNLALGAFNLLPAFPMDGGRVLRGIMALKLPLNRATQIAAALGEIIMVGLILLGIVYGKIMLIFVGIFLMMGAREEEYAAEAGAVFGDMKVKRIMLTDFLSLSLNDPLIKAMDALCRNGQTVFPVIDTGGHFMGSFDQKKLLAGVKKHGTHLSAETIVDLNPSSADPEENIAEVFAAMRHENTDGLAVLEDGCLVGLLVREHISRFFRVNKAIQGAPRKMTKPE